MSRKTYEILEIEYAFKRHKNTINLVFAVFLVTFVLSYVFIYYNILEFRHFGNLIYEAFKLKIEDFSISDKSSLDLIILILKNNLFVALFTYVIMFFALINIALNSYLLAYVLYVTEPLKFGLLILPHGIFEIPALILSGSSAIILFKSVILKFKKDIRYKEFFLDSLRIFGVSVLLFIIAAVIEVLVTYNIALNIV